MTMGFTGATSKFFLNAFSHVETVGLDNFLKIVESRHDPYDRQRGLITGTLCLSQVLVARIISDVNSWPSQSAITYQCK